MQLKILKTTLKFLALVFVLFVVGCSTTPVRSFNYFTLKVTSNPADAEVYINDKYIGRTPCHNIPFPVSYEMHNMYFEPYAVAKVLEEKYVIKVSKKGYQIAEEPIKFKKRISWDFNPTTLKTDYHFELVKEEQE